MGSSSLLWRQFGKGCDGTWSLICPLNMSLITQTIAALISREYGWKSTRNIPSFFSSVPCAVRARAVLATNLADPKRISNGQMAMSRIFSVTTMTTMLEKTVKAAVRKRLKELGAFQYWPVPTVWGTAAVDVIGCYQGKFFAIEAKAPGRRATDRQMFCMANIRDA